MATTDYTVMPTEVHTHTIIFLHGRDSEAKEFASEFFESQGSDGGYFSDMLPSFKWVFPGSKMQSSARFQTEMCQWFDMWSVEEPQDRKELQLDGLKESIAQIARVISLEATHVSLERIFLAGISQGCATAILTLLADPMRLGGFIGLSSWLPFQTEIMDLAIDLKAGEDTGLKAFKKIQELLSPATVGSSAVSPAIALSTPVFLSHSKDDEVVPVANGDTLEKGLKQLGMEVTRKTYPDGGHWINEPQGVDDIVEFLRMHSS